MWSRRSLKAAAACIPSSSRNHYRLFCRHLSAGNLQKQLPGSSNKGKNIVFSVGLSALSVAAVAADTFYGNDRLGLSKTGGQDTTAPVQTHLKTKTKQSTIEANKKEKEAAARAEAFAKSEEADAETQAEIEAEAAARAKEAAARSQAEVEAAAKRKAADEATIVAARAELCLASKICSLRAAMERSVLGAVPVSSFPDDRAHDLSIATAEAEKALAEAHTARELEAAATEQSGNVTLAQGNDESTEADGETPQALISCAKLRLLQLNSAAQAAARWCEAKQVLRQGIKLSAEENAFDLEVFSISLLSLQSAEAELRSLGIDKSEIVGFEVQDESLVSAASQALDNAHEYQKRREALIMLEKALASANRVGGQAIATALSAAEDAGVGSCDTLRLAKLLCSQPQELCQSLRDHKSGSKELFCSTAGVAVDDFCGAAVASASTMTELELREEAAALASALVRLHSLQSYRVHAKIEEARDALLKTGSVRVNEELDTAMHRNRALDAERRSTAEEAHNQQQQRLTLEARNRMLDFVNKEKKELQDEASGTLAASVSNRDEAVRDILDTCIQPLKQLEVISRVEERSQAESRLSTTLLALEMAMQNGHTHSTELAAVHEAVKTEECGFVSRLLRDLPANILSGQAPVPTAQELRRNFRDRLGELAASALAPPAEGLLGRAAAGVAGGFLAQLYQLRSAVGVPKADRTGCPSEAARLNLAVLAKAAEYVDKGDIPGALAALEALTGECRVLASGWVTEARQALILHQTLRAAQAQARCLNASLA